MQKNWSESHPTRTVGGDPHQVRKERRAGIGEHGQFFAERNGSAEGAVKLW
jgi:hypothetical protein